MGHEQRTRHLRALAALQNEYPRSYAVLLLYQECGSDSRMVADLTGRSPAKVQRIVRTALTWVRTRLEEESANET